VKNLAQLADGPTLHVTWQGQGAHSVSHANQPSLALGLYAFHKLQNAIKVS